MIDKPIWDFPRGQVVMFPNGRFATKHENQEGGAVLCTQEGKPFAVPKETGVTAAEVDGIPVSLVKL